MRVNYHVLKSYKTYHIVAAHFAPPALKVVIDVSYTPLEPRYQPPYYRAASPVTLTCRAVGGTGRIGYRWTSTCRSSCFVPYRGSYEYTYGAVTRSRSFLRSYDAGTHYCLAYDSSQAIWGSASTVMNVVGEICTLRPHIHYTTVDYPYLFLLYIGAGIYVTRSGSRSPSTSFRNNSIVRARSGYTSSTRMAFYCCSNSTSSGIGYIVGVNGHSYTSNFGRIFVSRSNLGCIYVYNSGYSSYLRTYEQGIYTCYIPDVRGRYMNIHVGIYRSDYTSKYSRPACRLESVCHT